MVNKIKKYIYQLVGFFGIGLILYRKRKRTNVVHFNKNEYFRFIEQNKAYDLYSDALNKITPKNELPDNDIYKELRFFSLMQRIKRALESNVEGNIVNIIQESRNNQDGLIINAGGYTHTSVAIHDALKILKIPVIELHITNIYNREDFRHKSLISQVATGIVCGFGTSGYTIALEGIKYYIIKQIN